MSCVCVCVCTVYPDDWVGALSHFKHSTMTENANFGITHFNFTGKLAPRYF